MDNFLSRLCISTFDCGNYVPSYSSEIHHQIANCVGVSSFLRVEFSLFSTSSSDGFSLLVWIDDSFRRYLPKLFLQKLDLIG